MFKVTAGLPYTPYWVMMSLAALIAVTMSFAPYRCESMTAVGRLDSLLAAYGYCMQSTSQDYAQRSEGHRNYHCTLLWYTSCADATPFVSCQNYCEENTTWLLTRPHQGEHAS